MMSTPTCPRLQENRRRWYSILTGGHVTGTFILILIFPGSHDRPIGNIYENQPLNSWASAS